MGHYDPGGWQRENPFTGGRNEMSSMTRLILIIVVLFICAVAYIYQSEILRFFQGSPAPITASPAPRAREPSIVPPQLIPPKEVPSESTNHIYRCGNTYTNSPCEGGKQIAQQITRPSERSDRPATREIYLCKDISDRLTWESVPCSANGRFMDRIARVPTNVSWAEQVAIAREQRNRAYENAAEQVVPVATRPTGGKANAAECQALDERVNWLDGLGRIGGGGHTMDWIREERRKARDRQFRIGC
ncbi:hypothetical protein JAO85_03270 [Comamonas sp. NyZ500]|uniref:hypothetical protein n=1 Tax=Comamonas sp. NyZ500 TaxID=2795732 RepID=UPI00192C1102|nr:hypothetical protein [Comamonas sp. NyZ500]MBL5976283.1 hypothetical protein [Comamonas sp. NyZ500]